MSSSRFGEDAPALSCSFRTGMEAIALQVRLRYFYVSEVATLEAPGATAKTANAMQAKAYNPATVGRYLF